MSTPLRRSVSRLAGWLADRRLPRGLRGPLYRAYCAATGADPSEAELDPAEYPSLGAFFVRRLAPGARSFPEEPELLPSPVDGAVQTLGTVRGGEILQAKGRPYSPGDLFGAAARGIELAGAAYWTLYLSPRDYHRVHAPEDGRIAFAEWMPGARRSVAPRVLARRPSVLATNERWSLLYETAGGPLLLCLVGALNVGRIRIGNLEPGFAGAPDPPIELRRGEELGRFEMGSTVVLVAPRGGPVPLEGLEPGRPLRLGEPIGRRPASAGPP